MTAQQMGPPSPGPVVWVRGRNISVGVRVEDDLDLQIITMAMQIAERRRYSEAACPADQQEPRP